MASNNEKQASMLGGHIQYAKGVVEETIGKVTSSHPWQESGKQDTAAGIKEMKKANAQNTSEPAQSDLGGKIEEVAGRAAGCEGMEREGLERQGNA